MAAAKVAVTPTDFATYVAETINRAELTIRTAQSVVDESYLEPDNFTASYQPAVRPEKPAPPAH